MRRHETTRRDTLVAGGSLLGLTLAGILLAIGALRLGGDADQHPSGESHAPSAPRTVVGPLEADAPNARVRLDVGLRLDEHDPRASGSLPSGVPVGDKVLLTLTLTDPASGAPLAGLTPSVEVQPASGDTAAGYGQASAETADPFDVGETFALVGQTGDLGILADDAHHDHAPGAQLARTSSNLSSLLKLPGRAAEAAVDTAQRVVFTTLPDRDEVALVDVLSHRLLQTVRVGKHPVHLAAEPSGARMWVANDGDGSVTAIDTATYATQTVAVGAGHHDLAFSADGRLVFVSNGQSGSVSVIDAQRAQAVAEVPVGAAPHGLDVAPATGRLYVANAGSGSVSVLAVDGDAVTPLATIPAGDGTTQVRIHPAGQVGAASNARANSLTIFDAVSNTVIKTLPTGAGPDGIVFLGDYALVRNRLSPDATFANVLSPDLADEVKVGTDPPVGPARAAQAGDVHARPFLSADGQAALVPSPANGQVAQLHVMMGRPMLMDQVRVGEGTDFLLPLGNAVREISPGTYQRVARFDREGRHTLRITPRQGEPAVEFPLQVVSARATSPWQADVVAAPAPYQAGRPSVIQVRVIDRQSGAAKDGLTDGVITVYRVAPGQAPWQAVLPTQPLGDGTYQASVTFPEAGTFSATFASRQLGLSAGDRPPAALEVVAP